MAFIVVSALLVATFSGMHWCCWAVGRRLRPANVGAAGRSLLFPWITRAGASWGLVAGLIGVAMTDSDWGGSVRCRAAVAAGRRPFTRPAGGILLNVGVCVALSAVTQNVEDHAHKMKFHNFLHEHAGLPESKRGLIPIAFTLAWFFFGIGPGCVIGNWIFRCAQCRFRGLDVRHPVDLGLADPVLVAWVGMMWFLAYKMEMSTVPSTEVKALVEDVGDIKRGEMARS